MKRGNVERELKFRVWSISSKSWIGGHSNDWVGTGVGNVGSPDMQPWKCMSLNGKIMSNDNMGGFVDSNQEDYVIQQATGVPDKNLKEIYEGDVISYRGRKGFVEFFSGMFVCSWNYEDNDDQTETELAYMITADMEVVGVKYE